MYCTRMEEYGMVKLTETQQMLKDLTDANGVPGNEQEARDIMNQYISLMPMK